MKTNTPSRLREPLIIAARMLLERDGPYWSIREACRIVGCSSATPFKLFKDRAGIDVALAIDGFKELVAACSPNEEGVYEWHLWVERNPRLTHLMFSPGMMLRVAREGAPTLVDMKRVYDATWFTLWRGPSAPPRPSSLAPIVRT